MQKIMKWFQKCARWCQNNRRSIWLLFLTMPLIALFLALSTEWGRVKLTRGAIASIEFLLPELNIQFKDIESPQFGDWNFSELSIYYHTQPMVQAKKLVFQVTLAQLLTAKIDIKNFQSNFLIINYNIIDQYFESHSKKNKLSKEPTQSTTFALPTIRVENIHIDKLKIISDKLRDFPIVSVIGSGRYQWPESDFYFQLEIRENGGNQLHLKLYAEEVSDNRYSLNFNLNELAGGFLSTRLQLPIMENLSLEGNLKLDLLKNKKLLVAIEKFNFPLLRHKLAINGSSTITLAPWSVTTQGLHLTIDNSKQFFRGSLNANFIDAEIQLDKLPIAIFKPWQNYLQDGWLSSNLTIKGPLPLPVISGSLDAESDYKNQPLHISAKLASHKQSILLKTAQVKLANAQLTLQGDINIGAKSLMLTGIIQQLSLLNLHELLAVLPQTTNLQLPPELTGTINKFTLDIQGPWQSPRLTTELNGNIQYHQLQAKLYGNAHGDFNKLTLSKLNIEGNELQLSSNGSVHIAQRSLQLQAKILAENLQLSKQLGLPVDANTKVNMNADVELTGALDDPNISFQLASHGNYQKYHYSLSGTAMGTWAKLQLNQWHLGLFDTDRDAPKLATKGKFSTADAWLKLNAIVEPLAHRGSGKLSTNKFPLSLLALMGVELPPSLDGQVSIDGQFSGELTNPQLNLSLLALGSYEDTPWKISGGLDYKKGSIDFNKVELHWTEHSHFSLYGSLSEQSMNLQAHGTALFGDLNQWLNSEINDSGEITARASITGTPQQPNLAGEVKLSGQAPRLQDDTIQPVPLQILLNWHTEKDTLQLKLDSHHGNSKAVSANIHFAITPFLKQLFARNNGNKRPLPIRFDASGNVDLSVLSILVDPQIQLMRGHLQVALHADGNSKTPNIQGSIDLSQGYYEYRPGNFRLQKITLTTRMTQDEWRIEQASAVSENSGSINLKGAVAFHQAAMPALDFKMTTKNVYLLNMPGIKGAFSGTLHLTGSTASALLEGKLNLRPLEVQIEYFMGSSVPEIKVINVDSDRSQQKRSSSLLQNVTLDVQIDLDKQSHVRGLGLDSELRGQVNISGTAIKPLAGGELNIARGKFDLLGKQFNLTQGQVQFENNMVAIFVKGVYDYPDGEITVQLSGTTDKLTITFSANPAAGQEEIFSQLLFGKSLSNISPFQAIRLAGLVGSLKSGAPGFDPVAEARKLAGLDTLDLVTESTNEGDQYALNLGKYITDRIYIQLQRSTDPLNPWQAQMHIELKDNLDLEIKSGDDTDSGAGSVELQWKKNY